MTLGTVANAVKLLRAFSHDEPTLGVSELARRLQLTKSTTFRLVATLAEEGLLERTADDRYRLGLGLFELGSAVVACNVFWEAGHVPLERLHHETNETTHLGLLRGREVFYLERLDSPWTMRSFADLGRRNSAHATSSGKCLLAFGPADATAAVIAGGLPRAAPRTITTPALLLDCQRQVKQDGYATSFDEGSPGGASVAVPILDRDGRCQAAVSVAAPLHRMPRQRVGELLPLVRACANRIAANLADRPRRGAS